MRRRHFLQTILAGSAATSLQGRVARASAADRPPEATRGPAPRAGAHEPIIDVHMHAYPADLEFPASLTNRVTGKPATITNGRAHLQACLAEMTRLNIVKGVVSGGAGDRLAAPAHWHDAAPGRIIAGAGVRGSADTPLPAIGVLRSAFERGQLQVFGEVTAMYAGLSLSDVTYQPYLALAEEFDVPVSLHTGLGPAGTSYDPCCRGFRASLGNPLLVEEALNRHPKLRVNLMHAGWPFLQETMALLKMYPQVYADLGATNWGLPRPEFHAYLGALMRAGFGKRLMFGSDHMYWPELIGVAVEAVDSAAFLTSAERADIFHGNAARFFKLKEVPG